MVQELAEVCAKGGKETRELLSDYDEKLRVAYEETPKIVFQDVLIQTGLISAPDVYDDFLGLAQMVDAEVVTGVARIGVDTTNDIKVKKGKCFGYSPALGGFVVVAMERNRSNVVRGVEEWNQEDWEMVEGVVPELTEVLDAFLPYAKAMSNLAKKAVENNPQYRALGPDRRLLTGR